MTSEEAYESIVRTCRRCQEFMDSLPPASDEVSGLARGTSESLGYWREHDARSSDPVRLEGADFRGLIFRNHQFRNHSFVNCDFSGGRWFLAGIKGGECTGSNFSGIKTFMFNLEDVDCSECDFSNAYVWVAFSIDRTIFRGANFSGATLQLSKAFHKSKVPPDFTGAAMNGCTFINESKFGRGAFRKWFTESQRAEMSLGPSNSGGGCFVATAACGPDSPEVAILREYRDRGLLKTAVGRTFVRCYYFASPIIARKIETSKWLRAAIRSAVVVPVARVAGRRLASWSCDFQPASKETNCPEKRKDDRWKIR